MDIQNKKVFFLLSFGHCGIDWTHALLTSHEKILILPAFSFYRGWRDVISNKTNHLNIDSLVDSWKRYIDFQYSDKEGGRFFNTTDENKLFYARFKSNLESFGLNRADVFYAIHEAYAYVTNINIDSINVIVEHEHVCFHADWIFEDFINPNIIFLLRDPRAALAGYYKGIERKCTNNPNCYHHLISKSWAEWKKATQIFYTYGNVKSNNITIIKYENLVKDIVTSARKLASILGVNYEKTLTIPTNIDGTTWRTDTGYISNDDPDVNRDEFFRIDEIKKRWMSVLIQKDIISIEVVFSRIMEDFGYKKMFNASLKNKLIGYLYAIYPHRGSNRYSFYKVHKNEKQYIVDNTDNVFLSSMLKINPLPLMTFLQYALSIRDNINIVFGRISRKYK